MEHQHTPEAIRQRLACEPRQSYLRDWIYGGIDGTITTFAIVSGVTGARLSPRIILILGCASLLADAFAMAAGNFLATQAEGDEVRYDEAVERRHIAVTSHGERQEVREILLRYGLSGDLLTRAVAAVTADRERWIKVMLRDEYGHSSIVRSAKKAAFATLSAFLLCGLLPLLPFAAGLSNAFPAAAVATGLMFLVIGAVKSRWSVRSWWYSGIETLIVGGSAAAVAYLTGVWLRSI